MFFQPSSQRPRTGNRLPINRKITSFQFYAPCSITQSKNEFKLKQMRDFQNVLKTEKIFRKEANNDFIFVSLTFK